MYALPILEAIGILDRRKRKREKMSTIYRTYLFSCHELLLHVEYILIMSNILRELTHENIAERVTLWPLIIPRAIIIRSTITVAARVRDCSRSAAAATPNSFLLLPCHFSIPIGKYQRSWLLQDYWGGGSKY